MNDSFGLAAQYIKSKMGTHQPKLGIILGSGLGVLAEDIENAVTIPYSEIDFKYSRICVW